jgi:hypothetical protein
MSNQPDSRIAKAEALLTLVGPVAWIATLFVAIVVCSPAQARTSPSRQTAINASVEGGYTNAYSLFKIGGHLALRTSLVSMNVSNHGTTPEAWSGGYARFQHGLGGSRAAIGGVFRWPPILDKWRSFIGLEGGLVVARDEAGDFEVGFEVTTVVTAGFIALYARTSIIGREAASRRQRDVGLRLNLPFFLLKSK